ncbi:MAG: 16S rRNA (cytosine(1402)-N(4))-methyltransferase RsmH [Kiritimatiellae bacterium]|nr:16S rRNA (cytosine(1402)-N(4))-methyltransferase RsmH [Kiritimatiellia bacterium]
MPVHVPVMLRETLESLHPKAGGRYIDATLGGGGHSEAILDRSGPHGALLGLDRDGEAVARCKARLAAFGDRFTAEHSDFRDIESVARRRGFCGVDGILFDFGVSSFQLDDPARGFSFRFDSPLDMRMDASRGITAAQWIAEHAGDASAIAETLRDFGEERRAARIAEAIVKEQAKSPIDTTGHLAAVVEKAVGGRRGAARHPATRTFQAIRIAVNEELGQIEEALEGAFRLLAEGGVVAAISFHSLEDRLVKRAFAAHEGRMAALPEGGARWEGELPRMVRTPRRAVFPTEEECAANPRARSARLRVATKVPASRPAASATRENPISN